MESTQELQHWGIKGQRWGVRRYENEDGSLTEAGKERYRKKYPYQNDDGSLNELGQKKFMEAARNGKLDYSRLSNAELDMINNRYTKESNFEKNFGDPETKTFKYKVKQAILGQLSGGGGGGGGKGKGKNKGGKGKSAILSILALPIKNAFEEAFKDTSNNDGGGGKDNDDNDRNPDDEWYDDFIGNSHRFVSQSSGKSIFDFTEQTMNTGKKFMGGTYTREAKKDSWSSGNTSSENILRSRIKPKPTIKSEEKKPKKSVAAKKMEKEDKLRERMAKSGLILSHSVFVIRRNSDELMHFGIKGQKWGVRRYENEDGTLTEEGKIRYGIAEGGNAALAMKFDRERNKQRKLNDNANIDKQKSNINRYTKSLKSDLFNLGRTNVGIITGKQVGTIFSYAGLGAAAMNLGEAAYNGIKISMAYSRVSTLGHKKAVREAKEHLQRMQKMFENTPYADLIKDTK